MHYQNKILNSSNPAKTAWKVISELTRATSYSNNIKILHDEHLEEDPGVIATLFNDFFIDAPMEVINKISVSNCNQSKHLLVNNKNSIFLKPFNEEELLRLLQNRLKNKSSSGPDEVPMFLLKKVLAYVIQPLTYLVNLSFVSGCFPTQLKVGKVVPIHKKHDPQLLDNYRPITVPSNFSKIFEYSFFDRLSS